MDLKEYYESHGMKVSRERLREGEGQGNAAESFGLAPFAPSFCQGVKADGSACRARPVKNNVLCWFHLRQVEASDVI